MRLWRLLDALRVDDADGVIEGLHADTGIDRWFLYKLRNIARMERRLASAPLTPETLRRAKRLGFADKQIASLIPAADGERPTAETVHDLRREWGILPTYKMVDTCAAEFEAQTPYYYSTYEQENEAAPLAGPKAVVLGSGPIRIGQGIEFDYCSVRAAQALRAAGVKSLMINSNPETVSTDFDMSDRLYFESLDEESVRAILENEGDLTPQPPSLGRKGETTANVEALGQITVQGKICRRSSRSLGGKRQLGWRGRWIWLARRCSAHHSTVLTSRKIADASTR